MQLFETSLRRLPGAVQQYEYHVVVLWLVLHLLPCAWTQPTLCEHFSAGSCDFYTLCIDSMAGCGPQDFAQAYAQRRCENLRQFNASSDSPLVRWVADQDRCLQGQLYGMLSQRQGQLQRSCRLQFQSAAFGELQKCYNSNAQQLCAALNATDSTAFLRDIPLLIQATSVSEYYSGIAVRQLKAAIASCNTGLPVNTAFPQAAIQHATYCIAVQPGNADYSTPDQLVGVFKAKYGGSWKYIGVDWDWRCVGRSNQLSKPVSPTLYDYFHFVTWYPNETTTTAPVMQGGLQYVQPSAYATYLYVLFSILYSNTTCGDGLLQAGELCDLAVYNGASAPSFPPAYANLTLCSAQCSSQLGVECYPAAAPLEPSMCTKVTCGDGVKASTEACDDGNTNNLDGCSSNCTAEVGYHCRVAGQLSLCKRMLSPPSSYATTASPMPHTAGTLHTFVGGTMGNVASLQPSSDQRVLPFCALILFFSFSLVSV